jgi:hypothetical protein
MADFKLNQVTAAIAQIHDAKEARARELKLRLQRLLVTDRRLGGEANSKRGGYAFYSGEPPGSGVEVMFSGYEAFALLAALFLLEHGVPQANVVKILRQIRGDLEAAHRETLKKDPDKLFDPQAVRARARPGMLATDNTAPVFLAFVNLTGSSTSDGNVRAVVTVCQGTSELSAFLKKYSKPAWGASIYEFVRPMRQLANNLSLTRPIRRGRSTI